MVMQPRSYKIIIRMAEGRGGGGALKRVLQYSANLLILTSRDNKFSSN